MSARLAKRRLVEPDYWTCPHGVRVRPKPALTYGPEVADLCAKAGYAPDPQQELGLDLIFAIRPDGSPATFAFCVICARQNLKSGLFLQACIGWMFVLDDVREIAWSAHELRTSLNAQRELMKILEAPALSKYLYPARTNGVSPSLVTANGQERVELNTGQIVWFQTRTRDGGRGLGKPKVILDEAFKLKSRIVGALLPILLAQHHPQLGYGSSAPPYDDDDAAVLRDVMDRGRNHKSPELSYLEWLAPREPCADPDCQHPKDAQARGIDCALDREHLIRRANPTLTTGRITMRTIRNLRQELPPVEFMRECLGWSEEKADADPPALDLRRWSGMENKQSPPPTRGVVVVDVEPDQSAATIGLAGDGPRGRTLLLVQHRKGTAWVAKAVAKLKEEIELVETRAHPQSPAGALIKDLKKRGIEVTKMTSTDMGVSCASFQTGVDGGRYVHVGQAEFDAAVAAARTRKVGQAEQWDREATTVPLGPVVAGSNAAQRWEELAAEKQDPPPAPMRAKPVRQLAGSIQTAGF